MSPFFFGSIASFCGVHLSNFPSVRAATVFLVIALTCGNAQEAPTTLPTGGGVLTTETVDFSAAAPGSLLTFQFGFATDEAPAANTLLDSFTVSIQPVENNEVLMLSTLDASGSAFALQPSGGIFVSDSSISRTGIPFPALSRTYSSQTAFHVAMPLPPELTEVPFRIFFDLFDNQDALASLGFFENVEVVLVPEPSTGALFFFGTMMLLWPFTRQAKNS